LKVKLVESKKIEDVLKQQLKEAETKGEKLEVEVVTIKNDLEKFQALYHQNLTSIKSLEGLASILNQQRNSKLKLVWVMKWDQVVVSQAIKNLSSLSNLQPLTTTNL
jgi:septal ring factor EnvC (AmiA/AmiB activator)